VELGADGTRSFAISPDPDIWEEYEQNPRCGSPPHLIDRLAQIATDPFTSNACGTAAAFESLHGTQPPPETSARSPRNVGRLFVPSMAFIIPFAFVLRRPWVCLASIQRSRPAICNYPGGHGLLYVTAFSPTAETRWLARVINGGRVLRTCQLSYLRGRRAALIELMIRERLVGERECGGRCGTRAALSADPHR